MKLEDDLRTALRREPAPDGFAARVLAKAKPRVVPFWRRPAVLAMAAVLVLAAVVPETVHEYRRRERALAARDQLLTALSITRVQLRQVRERIRQNTRHKL
jgi:hypothetical protein